MGPSGVVNALFVALQNARRYTPIRSRQPTEQKRRTGMTSIRRAVVFGGSGFIGRYVVQRLAHRGAVVTVVGRHAGQARFLQPMGDVGQIVPINADLRDEASVRAAIEGADAVVNLVGILAESGKQHFTDIQHQGAARIARFATAAGVSRLVQFSALSADPNSPAKYSKTKALGEQAVREAFPAATILRPSIVFGPEDQFFNRFAAMTRTLPFLPLIGGGETKFQPVYVGDVADAALAALDRLDTQGKLFELGGPCIYSFRELMELMLKEINRPGIRLVSIPFGLANLMAACTEWLPNPPITRDQVLMLKRDNIVSPGALTLSDLAITPTAPERILPTYLNRFQPGGWFSSRRMG
jgi:uncharacterized protein YbjT (DUF2867 family)